MTLPFTSCSIKGKVAAGEGESRRVAPQLEVIHLDDFTPGQQVAKLRVKGIGIGRTLRMTLRSQYTQTQDTQGEDRE